MEFIIILRHCDMNKACKKCIDFKTTSNFQIVYTLINTLYLYLKFTNDAYCIVIEAILNHLSILMLCSPIKNPSKYHLANGLVLYKLDNIYATHCCWLLDHTTRFTYLRNTHIYNRTFVQTMSNNTVATSNHFPILK